VAKLERRLLLVDFVYESILYSKNLEPELEFFMCFKVEAKLFIVTYESL